MAEEIINIRGTMSVIVSQLPEDESVLIWTLKGFLDSYNSPDFIKSLTDSIEKGFHRVAFDCAELNFISAEVLATLTESVKTLRQNNGDLLLVNMQPKVRELLDMLGFTKCFRIVNCDSSQIAEIFNKLCSDENSEDLSRFPQDVRCPHCKILLKAHKPGKFKCSECKNILVIDHKGHIIFS